MDQIVNDLTTSPALRAFTRQRDAIIRAESVSLQGIFGQREAEGGIFGQGLRQKSP